MSKTCRPNDADFKERLVFWRWNTRNMWTGESWGIYSKIAT